MAWCARDTYRLNVASLQTTEFFARVHDWFGMIPKEAKTCFLEFTSATYIKCTWIKGSHSFHQTSTSWASMKKMLSKVSNTNLLSNKILEKIKWCWWAQQQIIEISMKMEFHDLVNKVIALVIPKRYNGVCTRKQPRVRQHYEHRWFWFDLMIAHTQIKDWIRW